MRSAAKRLHGRAGPSFTRGHGRTQTLSPSVSWPTKQAGHGVPPYGHGTPHGLKTNCFLDFLPRKGFEAEICRAPDIQIFGHLEDVDVAFRCGASVVLTPYPPALCPKRPIRANKQRPCLCLHWCRSFKINELRA